MDEKIIRPVDLKEKRLARRWTQEELARKLGITSLHVSRIEAGRRNISFALALKVARVFGSITVQHEGEVFLIKKNK
ncbi:helix-turn-helix transcriptional regulator [Calderihabitans maritimus]|uniref:HTH cro/C1-type domain-containing protein n=1 Tax=Calderihabitans maritimus TaxID=1246530 RepID=A0A1Z5HN39_9FIRM|nr:helix-turn-helix transcriptional regulator [Calderihabitans maritimus]GAW90936.1 hypothetical protein KKC1_00980 [Calderihabitans maritimus]